MLTLISAGNICHRTFCSVSIHPPTLLYMFLKHKKNFVAFRFW